MSQQPPTAAIRPRPKPTPRPRGSVAEEEDEAQCQCSKRKDNKLYQKNGAEVLADAAKMVRSKPCSCIRTFLESGDINVAEPILFRICSRTVARAANIVVDDLSADDLRSKLEAVTPRVTGYVRPHIEERSQSEGRAWRSEYSTYSSREAAWSMQSWSLVDMLVAGGRVSFATRVGCI